MKATTKPGRSFAYRCNTHDLFAGDFDRFEVKHHFVSRLEWKDLPLAEPKCVRVYNMAAWKWNLVADNLGLEPGEIESIRRNHFTDDERVIYVFRHWFNDANNLPSKERYPKKWSGLIRLLKDSDLGELSEEVHKALSAPYSDVRGNIYMYDQLAHNNIVLCVLFSECTFIAFLFPTL